MYATSDRLDTWLIPSGTVWSRQYHESTTHTHTQTYAYTDTIPTRPHRRKPLHTHRRPLHAQTSSPSGTHTHTYTNTRTHIYMYTYGLTQRVPVTPLLGLYLAFFKKKSVTKRKWALQEVVQGHVASDHGWHVTLSRPGRSGEDEPGVEAIRSCVHKRRALNTRLSSGTSVGTFACPEGPYRKCRGEAGTKNDQRGILYQLKKRS